MGPSPPSAADPIETRAEIARLIENHGPQGEAGALDARAVADLCDQGSTAVDATVVVGDLRLSTFLLKEALAPSQYARFIVSFTEAVRGLVRSGSGWFDKFTGDGFIAFWIDGGREPSPTAEVPSFCRGVVPAAEALLGRLRRNSRNFPAGVGLSLGLDAGPCELVRVGGSLTLVGSPIVGATRMASAARAGETLANIYFGSRLEREPDRLAQQGVDLRQVTVATKEYPEGQEAFRLVFPRSPISPRDAARVERSPGGAPAAP